MRDDGTAFKNNQQLLSAGSSQQYTAQEVQEFIKCAQDPVYFIKTYMKIIQVDKGLVPFEMWEFQEDMVRCYHENRFSITMCSRQVGKSTTVIGYFLWYILFNVNVRVCISANKQKTAVDLLGRLKLAYENLPKFLQQGVTRWARLEIELANGSTCFAAATSSSAVRGGSYNVLLLDEFAFVPENIANEFYASTFPTITSGKTTKLIIVSTPNGMNLFHKFWSEAQANRNDFKPLFVHWSQVPGRDDAWKEETARNIGGPEKFAQEYECSFLSTAYTLIRPQVLQTLTSTSPVKTTDTGYYEYEAPQSDHTYFLTVDTASGQGLDSSAFVVFDVTQLPYKVVAAYENNRITTMEYPQVVLEYARHYNNAWVLIEVNDIGRDIAHILTRDHEYDRILSSAADGRSGQRISFGAGTNRHPGVRMTAGVKRSGCSVLKTLIENQQVILNDYRIIQQLSVFVQRGGTYEAETGHHDDLVMPLVMLGWASLQPNFAEVTTVRALDVYTQLARKMPEIPAVMESQAETPMPLGIMGDYHDDEDSNWLLH